MMDSFSFERLTAYRASIKLVKEVYKLISYLPPAEKFALSNQIQRAIVSVPSNIAEGCGRGSTKEKIHFIEIAYGSLLEAFCQIDIAQNIGYISEDYVKYIKNYFFDVSRLLTALRKSYQTQLLNS